MPHFNKLDIPDSLVEKMIEHGRHELPNECCGLLAGCIFEGIGIATTRFAVANDSASPKNYRSNPRDMFEAFQCIRECGLELLAIYHSHPTSEAVPSLRDIELNTYGESVVHMIVSLGGPEPVVRTWWLTETGFREAEWRRLQSM